MGGARPGGASVYFWADVARTLIETARANRNGYHGALLLGAPYRGPGGPFVEVRGFCDWQPVAGPMEWARELAASWRQTSNRIRRVYRGMGVVGWVGTREGGPTGLSPAEQILHRTLFNLGHQIAIRLDPQAEEWSMFGADSRGRLVGIGFNLVTPVGTVGENESARSEAS